MEARATFRGQSSTRTLVVLMTAIALSLFVGGAGGYVVRAITDTVQSTSTTVHRPFVVEQAPYGSPAISPSPEPTRDPRGFEVPI